MTQVQGARRARVGGGAEVALCEPAAAAAGPRAPRGVEGRDDETQLEPDVPESAETRADDEVDGVRRMGWATGRGGAAGLDEAWAIQP